jgi:glycerol 3-phosphatase-2
VTLSPLLQRYDNVILDLDGCVWVGHEAVPGSPEAIAALRAAGKRVAFATNNSWHPAEDQVTRLWGHGIQAALDDVVTVGGAMQHLLNETRSGRTAFVIGGASLHANVADAGLRVLNGTDLAEHAEVVVIGGTDDVTYDHLRTATLAARRSGDLLATARDPTLPMPGGAWPGTGALLAAVETASGVTGQIVGKPEPQLFLTAVDRFGDGNTIAIGDRLDTDIAAAAAAGVDAALVLSGGMSPDEVKAAMAVDGAPQPIEIAADLHTLVMGSSL